MKTLSVKQVAEVLSVSPRAVLKRLNNGQLKGTRRTNKYGVEEWWIYPTREIKECLEASGRIDILSSEADAISDADVVDVETQSFSPNDGPERVGGHTSSATIDARATTSGVAEELWNNIISRFLEELKERDQTIGVMRNELAEKDRQLKLLPDFQKQAEDERRTAELKELEAEALRKQIEAMQIVKTEAENSQRLAEEQIERLKVEKELEAKALELENEQLQKKVDEALLSAAKLEELERVVLELQKPKPTWFQKWFLPKPE